MSSPCCSRLAIASNVAVTVAAPSGCTDDDEDMSMLSLANDAQRARRSGLLLKRSGTMVLTVNCLLKIHLGEGRAINRELELAIYDTDDSVG
ncbi:MAG TPA: hypothetical protein VGR29_04475, partial [Thermomicrobiales bacterium]|nr:hypothetical protein [Thermomicrobiales bacterium]